MGEIESLIHILDKNPSEVVKNRTFIHLTNQTEKLVHILQRANVSSTKISEANLLLKKAQHCLDVINTQDKQPLTPNALKHPPWVRPPKDLHQVNKKLIIHFHYSVTPGEKSPLYAELLASYRDIKDPDRDDLINILIAQAFLQQYPLIPQTEDPDTLDEQRFVLALFDQQLREHILRNPTETINQILAVTVPDFKECEWTEKKFPEFISLDQSLTFNVLTGQLSENKKKLTSIPLNVLKSPLYESSF